MYVSLQPEGVTQLTVLVTGSPMSLYDFYMYLKHIEYSQENLEFYMWYVTLYGSSTSQLISVQVQRLQGSVSGGRSDQGRQVTNCCRSQASARARC